MMPDGEAALSPLTDPLGDAETTTQGSAAIESAEPYPFDHPYWDDIPFGD